MVQGDGTNHARAVESPTRARAATSAPSAARTSSSRTRARSSGGNVVFGDVLTVFGAGSPQVAELKTELTAASGSKLRNQAQADWVGMAVHCAQGSAFCAQGQADVLPAEPGGYTGYKGLFGAVAINPALTGSSAAMTDMLGNPIVDVTGNPGFPGFDGMSAAVTLRYAASMLEKGVPVVFGYLSDVHDYHGVAGSTHIAMGPGQGNTAATPLGYEDQVAQYDQAFANFSTELAAHGIDKTNTLFVVTVDEGDHFAGGPGTPAGCDGSPGHLCDYTGQIGELNANIDTLVQHQFPSLFTSFLASGAPYAFTVHGDDAPTFYLAKKGAGGGMLGQTDPVARDFERQIARVMGASANPYSGNTEKMMQFMADQTGMKALHMITTGDPVRNASFTFFANPDYFITDFPTSTCETCVPTTGSTFAWNHGDVQKEIGQTWVGYVGPGVANQPDQMAWTDHTDVKATINALLGLRDSYRFDGRVTTEALVAAAVPPAIAGERAAVEGLGALYKQINAPFGQFAADMLIVSTKALQGSDMGDATYASKEASIASLTSQRDALASQIRASLDEAQFASQPIDPVQIASWTSQAQNAAHERGHARVGALRRRPVMPSKVVIGATVACALALATSPALAADFSVTPATDFSAYVINGASNPTLPLVRGQTYTFDVQAPGHPFYIKITQVAGTGSQWTEGVTNPGQTGGLETFTVPADAPATLFYDCAVHPAMHGTLSITSAPVVPSGGLLTRGLVGALLGALGYVALGRLRRALARVRLPA